MNPMTKIRLRIARVFWRLKWYRAGCIARGKHLFSAGGCLICAERQPLAARGFSPREIQRIESTYERNSRIRRESREAREYGW